MVTAVPIEQILKIAVDASSFGNITAPFVITWLRQIWRQSETCVLAAVNQN